MPSFGKIIGQVGVQCLISSPSDATQSKFVPAITAGVLGTVSDFGYGYTVACKRELDDFNTVRENYTRNSPYLNGDMNKP